MLTTPEGYNYHTVLPIRYRDMDSLGHVNNVVYLTYIEQARIEYFASQGLWQGKPDDLGLILAKSTVEYLSPLSMDDKQVHIWTRISRLGNKSFDMQHTLICARGDKMIEVARGTIVMVTFDYQANHAIPIPTAWRNHISNYEPTLS